VAVVVDPAHVPPAERFGLWVDVSAQVFEPLAVAQLGQRPFAARLEHYGLGSAGIYHMRADASSADRTPRLIRAGDPELLQVMVQLQGACWITQDERRSVVRPGELTSWNFSRPYCVGGQRSFEALLRRPGACAARRPRRGSAGTRAQRPLFSRAFWAAYGENPSDFRRAALRTP